MTTRALRRPAMGLVGAGILAAGGAGFLIWNQQVEPPASFANTQAPPPSVARKEKADAKPAKVKTYQVDIEASRIYVKVGLATRLGHPHGVEGKLQSGKISLGGEGELVFSMKTFQADTVMARKKVGLEGKKVSENKAKRVTKDMLSKEVLDVETFPTANYQITAIKAEAIPGKKAPGAQDAGVPGTYAFDGRFTLHGTNKPLQFKAKVEKANNVALKLTGTFAIKQTDYGIIPYSLFGGLAKVADELEITGELLLRPAP